MKICPSVDWVTGVSKTYAQSMAQQAIWEELKVVLNVTKEAVAKPMNVREYKGYRCGPVFFGSATVGTLLSVSGVDSNDYVHRVVGASSRITRIDLAVTVFYPNYVKSIASGYYEYVIESLGDLTGKRKYAMISSASGGDTLYIGSRESEGYGRVYDKWMESKRSPQFLNAWRFEVEFKGELAQRVAGDLMRARDREDYIVSRVSQWLGDRLILCPWTVANSVERVKVARPAKKMSELEYLRTKVRGTVARLVKNGQLMDVLEALGVNTLVEPTEE